jgi:hypothetical protein
MPEIELPLIGGLDEKKAKRLIQPGAFLDLINARFDKDGQISQRYGTTALTTSIQGGGSLSTARAGHAFRSSPLLITDDKVYGYSSDQTKWIDRGRISTPQVSRKPFFDFGTAYRAVDHAYASGLIAVAALDATGLRVAIFDEATGALSRGWETLSVGGAVPLAPKVFIAGTSTAVVIGEATNGEIYAFTCDLSASNPSWSAGSTLLTGGLTARPAFDAAPVEGHANRFFVAYAFDSGGTLEIRWSIWNVTSLGAAVASGAVTEALAADTRGIGVYANNSDGQFWVAWNVIISGTQNRVKATAVNTSTAADLLSGTPFTVATLTTTADYYLGRLAFGKISTSRAALFMSPNFDGSSSFSLNVYRPRTLIHALNYAGGAITSLSNSSTYWLGLLSRPWTAPATESNRLYVCAQLFSSIQSTDYVCEVDISDASAITQMQVAARFATRLAGFNGDPSATAISNQEMASYTVYNVPTLQTGRYSVPHVVVVSGSGTAQRTQMWRTTIEFEPDTRHRGAAYRQSLILGGGVPQVFDGSRAYELGFHWYPEIVSISMAGSGGFLSAGAYLYSACYRFTLASGEIVRSAPSPPFAATAAASDIATVLVRSYTAGAMRGNYTTNIVTEVGIELYRTQVGGQTFTLTSTGASLVTNSVNAATVSITDGDDGFEQDSSIAVNLPLYTDGIPAPLENLCPPSLYPVVVFKGRLWGIADDRRTVWYSDKPNDGEQCRWHEVQSISVDEGEDLVGFVSTDQLLAVGTATKIFQLVGEPSDRLGNSSLTYQPIATSYGMRSPLSATCDAGAVFQGSDSGLKLFDRGGSIQSLEQVADLASANPFLSSIINVPKQSEVRLGVSASQSASTGKVLVFDTLRKAWLSRVYTSSVAVRDSWLVDGTYYFTTSAGQVYTEDTSSYTDSGTFVEMTMGLPWVSLGAIQGYQRCRLVRVLGDRHTAHDVEFTLYYDHSDSATTTRTFTDSTYGTLTLWQLEHSPARQKCQRFRVQVKTKTPTGGGSVGTGRGASWQSVLFTIEQYAGPGRTSSGRRG